VPLIHHNPCVTHTQAGAPTLHAPGTRRARSLTLVAAGGKRRRGGSDGPDAFAFEVHPPFETGPYEQYDARNEDHMVGFLLLGGQAYCCGFGFSNAVTEHWTVAAAV